METLIIIINKNWIWLGPLLILCFGAALIWVCIDIFGEVQKEMEDGTEEWSKVRDQMSEAGASETTPTVYPYKTTEREGKLLMKNICPNCGHKGLRGGPRGGLSQNVLCPNCKYEFLAALVPTWCEWMGPASKERLAWPYGIESFVDQIGSKAE
jgi:hypothetical protein